MPESPRREDSAPLAEHLPSDALELQACIRDLVSLLALPALWSGSGPDSIADVFVRNVLGVLRAELVYLRLAPFAGTPMMESACAAWERPGGVRARDVGAALRAQLREDVSEVTSDRGASLWVLRAQLGLDGETGELLVASPRADFPRATERMLVRVAANQLQIGLRGARLMGERQQVQAKLEDAIRRKEVADQRKDEFLAMLGHELRNPLAPILSAVQLMELKGEAATRREREVIERQARHLTRLVDDLLDISRVTRGKIVLQKERMALSAVVGKALEIATPLLEQRHHHLTVDTPPEPLWVEADAVRLSQVIANLLTNAAKYTDPGGEVRVRARRAGGEVEVAVEDNGHGIARELLPSVFELFVQGDRPADRALGGLGVGLALVRSLTELHGGRVAAESEGVGRGSRFVVRLPALVAPEETATAPPATDRPSGSARILVADDNVDAADTLAEALRELGYEVVVAHDGPTALGAAHQFHPQTALLDIGLPGMDGYELARRLRAELTEPLRLIAITGYGQDSDRATSRDAGFDLHLVKPVELDALVSVLR